MKLSPINPTTADALESELSQTLFQNSDQFIQAYNSGMVNKRNPSISEIAQKISQTYRNIELAGSELTAISTDAISLNEIFEAHARWSVIVAIKNAIHDFTPKNEEAEVTGFVLSDEKKRGVLFAVLTVEETEESDELDDNGASYDQTYTRTEFAALGRVAKNAETAKVALGELASETVIEGLGELAVSVKEAIREVDTSFLERAAEELSQH